MVNFLLVKGCFLNVVISISELEAIYRAMVNFLLVKGCFLSMVISIAELEAIELW